MVRYMTPELEDKLIRRFPMVFASRYADMSRTCMCWGMSCGDGWYEAIYLACLGIEEEYNKYYPWYKRLWHRLSFHIIPRWNKFISHQPEWMYKTYKAKNYRREFKNKRFYIHMPSWAGQASQVKEKFGTLRFYLHSETDKMSTYVDYAERLTENLCETCGKYGKLRGKGWYYTSCEEHAKEQDKEKESVE